MICFHLCERMLPKSGLGHSVFKTNRMDVFVTHLLGFLFSCNKSLRIPGSPCQGSCHHRWRKGSFSLPQPRWRSASLLRGSQKNGNQSIVRLAKGAKKAKVYWLFSRGNQVSEIRSKSKKSYWQQTFINRNCLWWIEIQISLPLTREVAKRSFDGGRERGKA